MKGMLIRVFYFVCGAMFGAIAMAVVAVGAGSDRDDEGGE